MTVDSKRHDHNEDTPAGDNQEKLADALPPTLFALPNLAETVSDCTQSFPDKCETATCGETKPQSEPVVEESLPLAVEKPVTRDSFLLEEVPAVVEEPPTVRETTAAEEPVQFQPIADAPVVSAETTTRSEESFMGIWATRAVVIGLLLVAVTAAVIAARKDGDHSEQTFAQDEASAIEQLALDEFDISEGVEINAPEVSEDATESPTETESMLASVGPPAVQANQPAESNEPVTEIEIAATPASAGPTAVLSAPVAETVAGKTPITEVNDAIIDTVTGTKNEADITQAIPVSAATNRSDLGPLATATPGEATSAVTKEIPTSNAVGAIKENLAGQPQLTANLGDGSVSMPGEITAPQIANSAPVSESVRYSSTPNAITDLTRFLPMLPTANSTTNP